MSFLVGVIWTIIVLMIKGIAGAFKPEPAYVGEAFAFECEYTKRTGRMYFYSKHPAMLGTGLQEYKELFEGQGYEIIVVDIPLRHYENLNMLVCDNICLRRADGMPI